MEFYQVIEKRNSASKFSQEEVDKASLNKIIKTAMDSPSWKNNKSYRIVLVDDKELIKELSQTLLNDTDEMKEALKEAPLVALVIGVPSESEIIDGKEYYLVDGAIAMQHLILAATNEGYGTCWLGCDDEEKIKSILKIPENFKLIGMTPIGKAQAYKPPNPQKDSREYVFLNTFGKALEG